MIRCKDAAALASQAYDRKLRLRERIALRLHTLLCSRCTRYLRQLAFIKNACEQVEKRSAALAAARLSEEARQRMLRELSGHR